jgi:hypothetical protein
VFVLCVSVFVLCVSVFVCVCLCECVCMRAFARARVNCFSSSTDGVFLVPPLPVSFAIKCYSLSSQSRIADIDDDVKYIMCTVNVFFLSFRFSGYEDGADVPDLLLYDRGVRHVCGKGPQPLPLFVIAGRTCKNKKEAVFLTA